jgi:hypothetical protein
MNGEFFMSGTGKYYRAADVTDAAVTRARPITLASDDAARVLGIQPKTLANWRSLGKGLAYIHLSDSPRSQVLYFYEDLEAWTHSLRRCGGDA